MRGSRRRMRLRLSPLGVAALLLLVLLDREGVGKAALLAALLHEGGHVLAARLLSMPLSEFCLEARGARLASRGRMLSYGEEWLLAAAGPLCSLLVSGLGFLLPCRGGFLTAFSAASLLLGLLNLLPVRTLDGGRMLEILLERTLGVRPSRAVMGVLSFSFLFLLWAFSVYLLLLSGDGLSLLCFSTGLFTRFLSGEEEL